MEAKTVAKNLFLILIVAKFDFHIEASEELKHDCVMNGTVMRGIGYWNLFQQINCLLLKSNFPKPKIWLKEITYSFLR